MRTLVVVDLAEGVEAALLGTQGEGGRPAGLLLEGDAALLASLAV
jgi:hypothetical protein